MAYIGLRDANTGIFFIKHGPSFGDQISYQWVAGANYQVFAADFDGDGVADIGLRDSATGIILSNTAHRSVTRYQDQVRSDGACRMTRTCISELVALVGAVLCGRWVHRTWQRSGATGA
jgi:hypothetical protein